MAVVKWDYQETQIWAVPFVAQTHIGCTFLLMHTAWLGILFKFKPS